MLLLEKIHEKNKKDWFLFQILKIQSFLWLIFYVCINIGIYILKHFNGVLICSVNIINYDNDSRWVQQL